MPSFKIIRLPVLEKNIFLRFLTIYGHGGHLGHVTWTIYINLRFPYPRRLHIKFGFHSLSGLREEDLKMVNDNTNNDDGRRSMGIL